MKVSKSNYIMTIYGKKGSGKSYFADYFTKNLKRLFVIDTMRIFDNAEAIYSIKKLQKIIKDIRYNKIVSFRYAIRLQRQYFDIVMSLLIGITDFTLVIDELQVYVSSLKIPDNFEVLLTEGRHFQINFITITQRPVFIPRIILANADYIVAFETNLKSDLDVLATYKYFDEEKVKNLKDYEFFIIDLKHKKSGVNKIAN